MLGCQYNVVVADILTQCKVTFGLCKSAAARSIYSTSILWLHTIRQRRPISSAHFLCNVDFDIVRCGLIIGWQYLLSKILTYYLRISAEYLYISNNIKGASSVSRADLCPCVCRGWKLPSCRTWSCRGPSPTSITCTRTGRSSPSVTRWLLAAYYLFYISTIYVCYVFVHRTNWATMDRRWTWCMMKRMISLGRVDRHRHLI